MQPRAREPSRDALRHHVHHGGGIPFRVIADEREDYTWDRVQRVTR